ncbi:MULTISPECIES: prolyl oligopeptidase family serine peptidase [unclassified Bradyrhizobium]|uniref:prolyl oligopeptidase family serine peptidase n=1 Tax=unclassified Bradyrhizobium TaxID=2631580 RepID=UPI0030CCD4E2
MQVESAEIAELIAAGWQPPVSFNAKGRDGETDIWGVIHLPVDFDRNKRYRVVEHIYAGPTGSFVPKSFSASSEPLTQLGFIVVQIDGMGTNHHSRASHDVALKNLKDAGLPDRILWYKAASAKYSWYDVASVGIFGGAAGGQNAASALLFHPDFYKVAVAYSGCCDNRLDKIWWNEQWMGWPVGIEYSQSSAIDNAHRLEGKLLLIVGEMDRNVDPSATFQLADRLIKAGNTSTCFMCPVQIMEFPAVMRSSSSCFSSSATFSSKHRRTGTPAQSSGRRASQAMMNEDLSRVRLTALYPALPASIRIGARHLSDTDDRGRIDEGRISCAPQSGARRPLARRRASRSCATSCLVLATNNSRKELTGELFATRIVCTIIGAKSVLSALYQTASSVTISDR